MISFVSFPEQHGINHGIELHEDCLRYAYERLEEFKQTSLALNEFDFCEPVFIQGKTISLNISKMIIMNLYPLYYIIIT